jgi:PAS domain S-box-containing protein
MQAEKLLQATKRDVAAMPLEDLQQLVYELQVFQIELDLQNDELRQTHVELEAVRDQYADLYDFSPAGLLMLDSSGAIVHANLRAGMLLGVNRQELIGQTFLRFVDPEDQPVFQRHCQEVVKTDTRHACEVQIRNKTDLSRRRLYLESLAAHAESAHITHWRTAMFDISDWKQATGSDGKAKE